jgi:hypothetical protein
MAGMPKNHDPGLSRRGFLTAAVGAGSDMLLAPACLHGAADAAAHQGQAAANPGALSR